MSRPKMLSPIWFDKVPSQMNAVLGLKPKMTFKPIRRLMGGLDGAEFS